MTTKKLCNPNGKKNKNKLILHENIYVRLASGSEFEKLCRCHLYPTVHSGLDNLSFLVRRADQIFQLHETTIFRASRHFAICDIKKRGKPIPFNRIDNRQVLIIPVSGTNSNGCKSRNDEFKNYSWFFCPHSNCYYLVVAIAWERLVWSWNWKSVKSKFIRRTFFLYLIQCVPLNRPMKAMEISNDCNWKQAKHTN